MNNNVLVRVDGSRSIGLGHLMRILVVANYFKTKQIQILFLTKTGVIRNIVITKGFNVTVLPSEIEPGDEILFIKNIIMKNKIDIVITDINNGYTFENDLIYKEFMERLKDLTSFVISFEDFKDYPYTSDLVIIPYLGAEKLKLHKKPNCKYLLGPKYFILREEFLKVRPIIIREKVENVLITMGGSDPQGITLRVAEALNDAEIELRLKVVIGFLSKISKFEINNALRSYNGAYSIIKNAGNMAKIMATSDIAITNSGLIKYETSAVGLPSIVISKNEEHTKLMNKFAEHGSVLHLGAVNFVTKDQISEALTNLANNYDKRKQMANAGKSIVDGKGVERIFSEIPMELIYA